MNNNVKKMVICGVVAAIYVVLTIALSGISYGGVQFRVAEALMLLCVFKKEYCVALSVGCFISNMFSPMPLDMVIGTLATVVAVVPMYFVGKLYDKKPLPTMITASLFPTVSNGIIIGLELNFFYGEPLFISMAQVAFGEFVCVSVLGVILFRIIEKNKHFMRILRFSQ